MGALRVRVLTPQLKNFKFCARHGNVSRWLDSGGSVVLLRVNGGMTGLIVERRGREVKLGNLVGDG